MIRKKFKTAVTDSGREVRRAEDKPGVTNLIDIMSVATGTSPAEIEAQFADAGYGQFKEAVGEAVVALVTPVQERYRGAVAPTRASSGGCSRSARRRRARPRRRRSRRCTSAWASPADAP